MKIWRWLATFFAMRFKALKSLLILHLENLLKWAINLCARSQRGIHYSIFCVWYTWIIHFSFVSNSSRKIYFLLLSLTKFSDSTSRSNKEKMIFHLSGFVYKCTYSQHLQANIYLGKLKLTLSFGCKVKFSAIPDYWASTKI